MEIEELIKSIAEQKAKAEKETHSTEGMLRLQEVASRYDGEFRLIWSDALQAQIEARPRKALHMTGEAMIDNLLGGLREQMMIAVAAHSGHGKTAMGLYLLKKYEYLNPVMIPLEQSGEELIEQRLANGQFVPKFLSPEKHAARARPNWIEERIVEGIAKYNTKMVVIDHLGYTDPDPRYDREQEPLKIERKLQEFKNIAKRWNVIVVILVQITQLDEATPPSLLNLKGSSSIRQECDKVILLWRKNTLKGKVRIYQNETLFSLQKNRWSGKNGNIGLLFDPNTGEYNVANEWVAAMEAAAMRSVEIDDEFA
jgi:replicative DNA helicase